MKTLVRKLHDGMTLVADGAWGTLLQQRGMRTGECPELWCVEHRDDVLQIARGYIAAGADMIKTNSFGGTRLKLDMFGLGDRVNELNEAAAAISREAAGPDRHVIASMGPSGKMLLAGDTTEEELFDAFRGQAIALQNGGADACLIETMMATDEAAIAIKAVRESTSLEVLCTFTFQKTVDGTFRTLMGNSPAEAARAASDAGAHIVGSNCGNGMDQMIPIVKEIRAAIPGKPIIVNANAGMPVRVGDRDVFPETPEQMAALVPALMAAGASIIGGCCGTSPAHISAIAVKVRESATRQ